MVNSELIFVLEKLGEMKRALLFRISSASKLIIFGNSSGEEENPRGGDSLSTRGLRAAGLLRRPCQG